MTKLPVVNGRECISALQRGGFVIDRQKGSHITLIRDDPFARATVPKSQQTPKARNTPINHPPSRFDS